MCIKKYEFGTYEIPELSGRYAPYPNTGGRVQDKASIHTITMAITDMRNFT